MAFVPGFEYDVFISYAHIDNQATKWVETLANAIRDKASEFAGAPVAVWRDPKLNGNDYFDDVITKTVKASAVFVAVVSPRYIASASCRKEYQAFVSGQRNIRVGEKSRIARVLKTPLPAGTSEPPEFASDSTLGFPFFEAKDGQLIEFENNQDLPEYPKFWETAKGLAGAIEKVLRLLTSATRTPNQKHIVFLADTVRKLAASREELARELLGRGHTVLPEHPLLIDGAFARADALQAISMATLAVHLVGDSYGLIPEGEERSLPHLELELASARPGLPQFVWAPPALDKSTTGKAIDSKLEALIDHVTQAETIDGKVLEVCKTDFVAFKEVVLDALAKDHSPPSTVTNGKSIYLLFHNDDIDSPDLKAIRSHLLDAGYPVNPPVFEAPDGELRQIEEQLILDNDATIIYYGQAKDSWIANKRRFLLAALGSAQRGAQNRRALYLCAPTTKPKEFTFSDFRGGKQLREASGFSPLFVVGDFEQYSKEKLKPLLDWLSK